MTSPTALAPARAGDVVPPPLALSTMWAVQPRFEHDLLAFMEQASALGFSAIELNHSMDAQQVGAALASRALPVASVHAPAPLERLPGGRENRALDLSSLDEQERQLAVRHTRRSIEVAAEGGARHVVVHLGGSAPGGRGVLAGERRLRELYTRRDLLAGEWDRTIDTTVRERARHVEPVLAAAARSLAELAPTALARGVALGIECLPHYHQLPLPHEAATLLAPYPTSVAGYWHDAGHAEVLHRLGLVDRSAWFDLLTERLIGVHLHDVRGLVDHRAPGGGETDFAWLGARLPAAAARTLEVDQHEPDDHLARGIEVLRAAGVIA